MSNKYYWFISFFFMFIMLARNSSSINSQAFPPKDQPCVWCFFFFFFSDWASIGGSGGFSIRPWQRGCLPQPITYCISPLCSSPLMEGWKEERRENKVLQQTRTFIKNTQGACLSVIGWGDPLSSLWGAASHSNRRWTGSWREGWGSEIGFWIL